jgi:hypothetical protein
MGLRVRIRIAERGASRRAPHPGACKSNCATSICNPTPQVSNNAFVIAEAAGQFDMQGPFNGSEGAGTWTFVPNATFARELQRRGVNAPNGKEQFELAIGHFTLAELDALLAAGFARPSAADLVRMQEHGVNLDYITALKGLRFSPKTVDELVRLRDHGVTPQYIRSLQALGYVPTAQELVRLRDHGVTAQYVQRLRSHGYTHLTADELIRLRDNGF